MTTLVTSTGSGKLIASQGYDPLPFEWQVGPSVSPSMHSAAQLIIWVDDNWALFGDSVMAESYSIHSSRITFSPIKA